VNPYFLPAKQTMQVENGSAEQVANLINDAQKIAVVPSKVAGVDAFSAAVGLYYMLLDKQKSVSFVHTGKMPEPCSDLIKKDEVLSNIFQRELVVSIDYSGTSAAVANYATEGDVLHISISPIPKNFEAQKRVNAKIKGFGFDVIFVVGAQELGDLGQTFSELKDEFEKTNVVNIDTTAMNRRFGSINIVDAKADSLSSLVFKNSSDWKLVPGKKAARALLTGIAHTNGSS